MSAAKYGNENLDYFPEYFDIDYTWWTVNYEHKDRMNYYDWSLKVAVEHENNWRDWTYEVEKLDFIVAPLKVVIGYLPNKKRQNEKQIIKKQMEKMHHLPSSSSTDEYGLILLNQNLIDGENDPFGMKCYKLMKDDLIVLDQDK